MPRNARFFVPGLFVYIMARGIDGLDIFIDDADRSLLFSFLGRGLRKADYRFHAWTLMSNHYHLLVRTSEQLLSTLMRRCNSAYAQHVARTLFAYLCRTEYGLPVVEIGRYLGISGPPMSIRIAEGERLVQADSWRKIFRNLRP